MANKMRWRYGDTNPVAVAVDSAVVIEIGDFVYLATDDARNAAAQADQGTEAANQQLFAENFLGIAMQASASGDTDPIRIATSGVFEVTAASATYEIGSLVGADEASGGTALEDQVAAAVASSDLAIGKIAKAEASATTTALVQISSRVMAPSGAAASIGNIIDLNGVADALVLDADRDTTISAPTDDQIDIEIAGADDFTFTANSFDVLTGSAIDLADSCQLKFGTGDDITMAWDGTDFDVLQATADSSIKWGIDGAGIDQVWYGDTASESMTWDQSADDLILTAAVRIVGQGSTVVPVIPLAASQTLAAGGGAVTITEYYTAGASDAGGDAWTLADGAQVGQLKKITLITDGGGDATLTPSNLSGGTTITFADVGDTAVLAWDGTNWIALELLNYADGTSAPVLA